MTENEIREILQTEKACVTRAMKNECNRDCYNCDLCEEGKDILSVYDSVIEALKEREQYRAIGTIEDFKDLKEKEERFDRNIRMFNSIGLEIRAKAIHEFAERICNACSAKSTGLYSKNGFIADIMTLDGITETVAEIAEQMKGSD